MNKYKKFIRFLINGGIIGLVSWLLQVLIYWGLLLLPKIEYKLTISIYLSFVVVIFINFHTLKKYVFKSNGLLYRFILATTVVVVIIGITSEVVFNGLYSRLPDIAPYISYPFSALIVSPFSFYIKNRFVFN